MKTTGALLAATDLQAALGRGSARRAVLHGVTLALAAGQWVAVVGPNGAGKSTLLQALAGLLPCDGRILLQGRPLAQWPARARARTLAWLGQQEAWLPDSRALDVVLLGRRPWLDWWQAPTEADWRAVHEALQRTGAWHCREQPMGALSGGERQRVLLARALAVQAQCLLLDEPLQHLDPPQQAEWRDLVREEVAAGHMVCSVLHDLNLALQADQVVILAEGRVAYQGAPAEPGLQAALRAVFGPRLRVTGHGGRWIVLAD